MCTALEYLSIRYLLTAKDKIITLQWKNLAGITLTRSPRQASPAVRRVPSTHALMWCEEQGAVSGALLSKKRHIPDFNLDETSD